ncbi:major facilitator superfamily domain-containing protein [Alternaria rosae]|uniref:major facilitator superfamily domain-containing protein n=1 Tax=Alternaria rosae TaxID=1187941 RepID=UPI001E8ED48A|nr:major facilitator superfamily domain-containing protein [Alternaria rosae]KAH6878266.1 major facilitator superfamily domain-containing protein [Alternaria rosae]
MSNIDSSTPLLTSLATPSLPSSRSPSPMPFPTRKRAIWPLVLLLLLVQLSSVLYTLPLNRVIELRLCKEFYQKHDVSVILPDGSIPELLCKIKDVQRKLAWLQGSMETMNVIFDFVVTIPFSFIAEKWGVSTVLWCNLVPRIVMSAWAIVVGNFPRLLPTESILTGSIFNILGGECVFQSTIFTLTSALTSEYVQRASYFSYISSTSYIVSFMGPTLAAFIMSKNLWLPFWLNIGLLLCAIPTISLLPNTTSSPHKITSSESPSDNETEESGPLLDNTDSIPTHYTTAFNPSPGIYRTITQTIFQLLHLVLGRRNFQILLTTLFFTALASSDTKLLVQYISKRYNWTFAQAGYLLSAKALVNLTLLVVVVPRLIRTSISAKAVRGDDVRLNVLGARVSIAVSVLGVLCIAVAGKFWMLLTALIIYALGSALPVFTMSLVKSPLVALEHSDAQDFSIVMLTKTLGSLVGAPLMTVLWVKAIEWGGAGLGFPYVVSCVSEHSLYQGAY